MKVVTKNIKINNIQDLKEAIENYGWLIFEYNIDSNIHWELYQYSPAGEDFGFSIEHNNNEYYAH